jgi:hypothetical protein
MSTVLLVAGALGLLTPSHLEAWLLIGVGLFGWATTIVRCVLFARRSNLSGLPPIGHHSVARSRLIYRSIIAWLHLIQPVARIKGRLRGLWTQPESARPEPVAPRPEPTTAPVFGHMGRGLSLLMGRTAERAFWSESWVAPAPLLSRLVSVLRTSRPGLGVDVDDGWRADRDVSVAAGRWGWLHVRVLVEEHPEGRCLVRVGTRLRPSALGSVQGLALALPLAMAASAATALQWPAVSLAAAVVAVGIGARAVWDAARTGAVLDEALARVAETESMMPMPTHAALAVRTRRRPTAAGAIQAATVAMLFASVGLGVVSVAREVLVRREAPFAVLDASDLRYESAGGVAVGVSGDLFVAESGSIERLRPRPPIDAALTADELGSDVNPLLGSPVPFDAAADIAIGPNGTLYVADARRNRVCRVERATGEVVTIVGTGQAGFAGDAGLATGAMLRGPGAIALAHNGDLYIADTLNNRVRVLIRATGRIRTIAGDGAPAVTGSVGDNQPASRGHLNRPSGVAVAPNGDVYIADTGHNRIRKVNGVTGIITTVGGDGTEGALGDGEPATNASLAAPMGLALVPGPKGLTIYVADSLNDRVRVIDVDGRIWTLAAPEPIVAPVRIAYHPAGWLYVKDSSPDGVTAVAASTPLNATVGAPSVSRREM